MGSNVGFDDGHPYVEVGADEGRFLFTGGRLAVASATASPIDASVERSVDNGETWEPVITDIAPEQGAGFVDWESPVYGEILYRATAYTVEGAAASTIIVVNATSHAIWLSSGDGFSQTARLPFNPKVGITAGRARTEKHFAGRSLPVAYVGEQLSRVVTVAGRTTDRNADTTQVDRLIELIQNDAARFLYRDPDRRRIYGTVKNVDVDRESAATHADGWNGIWGYGFTVTEAT